MSDHTYRVIEVVGTAPTSITDAVTNGISRAAQTVDGLDWFEIVETRGHIDNGAVAHFQVQMKVGFRLLD